MGGVGVRRHQRQFGEATLDPVAQGLSLTNCVDLLAVEHGTDNEARAPGVADETLDARDSQPVVAF